MVLIRNDYVETVLVAESDDHLAAVEEAKRTGQPLQSVAAGRTFAVPHAVATQIANEKSLENTYVDRRFGATYAGHLEDYHNAIREDPDFIPRTNEEKAAAHERYSAELVRRQMEDNQDVLNMMADGYDPSLAVQQANLERAREHEAKSADYEAIRQQRAKDGLASVPAVIDEMVRVVRANDLSTASDAEKFEAFANIGPKPDSMERATNDALVTKDNIVATVASYEDHAMQHDELVKRDRPGIEIMQGAGSPEALRENSALAQAAANNPTPEAAKAIGALEDHVRARDGEDITNEPGRVLREAETEVDPLGRPEADEMPDNPTE